MALLFLSLALALSTTAKPSLGAPPGAPGAPPPIPPPIPPPAPPSGLPEPPRALSPRLPTLTVHRTDDAAECPDARALAARVARHMKRPALEPASEPEGRTARVPVAASPGLDVQFYRSEAGYTAVVQATLAEAAKPGEARVKTRQLSDKGSSCKGLADALAIALAVLLDAEPLPPAPAPEPAPAAPPSPPPEAAPSRESPARVEPPPARALEVPPPRTLEIAFGAGVVPFAGLLDHDGIAGSGYVEARIRRWLSVRAGALAVPSQTFAYRGGVLASDGSPAQIGLWLTTGMLEGCFAAPLLGGSLGAASAPLAGGCMGILAGAIHGEGLTLPNNAQTTAPWAAGRMSAFLEQRLAWRLSLVFQAGAVIPFIRRYFAVDGEGGGTAFTPASVGVTLATSVRLSIW